MNINHEDGDKQEDGRSGNGHDLSADVHGILGKNRSLREENSLLKEKINQLNVNIAAQRENFAKAKASAEDLKKENGSLKAEKDRMKGEISRLSEAFKSLESEREQLVKLNGTLSSAVDQLGIENEKLSSAEEKLAMENVNLSSMAEENQLIKKDMDTMASELSSARSLVQRAIMDLEAERASVASLRKEIKKLSKRSILRPSAVHYAAAASAGAFATAGLLLLYKTLQRNVTPSTL